MKIFVINCGSSSLKYQLFNMENEDVIAKGLVERIGLGEGLIKHEIAGRDDKIKVSGDFSNHTVAIDAVFEQLTHAEYGVIEKLDDIQAIGHRVVHGGTKFTESAIVDEDVKKAIKELFSLAPLHNPPNLMGIEACEKIAPQVPQVVVFDTAFHQSMPEYAYSYALPYEDCKELGVRKYGFHGTSHKYVSQRAAEILGVNIEDTKMITCHLGNGASVAAVKGGKSIETSMGLTPLEGLIMGTRCGDIDPAVIPFVMEKKELDVDGISNYMNKKSGVLGISGVSSDFRDIEEAAEQGNQRAQLALDMFAHRVKRYIGSYSAAMNGVDTIIFTAGLGENSADMRAAICEGLDYLGVKIDKETNNVRGKETVISTDDSKVKVLVVPTNEELMIARDAKTLVG
ncbi:acetate kinase [Desulfitispora alkaliphila]|uniref:acetate/propionate family kinase n=1 Tax=Desulfitispora alkaliphila TaxID=622674 RepID=UPI003D204CCD